MSWEPVFWVVGLLFVAIIQNPTPAVVPSFLAGAWAAYGFMKLVGWRKGS